MRMKIWLYIGFFVVFIVGFSQVAFPLGIKLHSITINPSNSPEKVAVFKSLQSTSKIEQEGKALEVISKGFKLKSEEHYRFIDYVLDVESVSLLPLNIKDSSFSAGNKYKDRIIARVYEPSDYKVSIMSSAKTSFSLLIDIYGMNEKEIKEMVEDIGIHMTWNALGGWQREHNVFINKEKIIDMKN